MTETERAAPKFRLRLKELRKARGWSQMQLAARADSHPAEISRIEHGVRSPGADLLARLATALELEDVGQLFEHARPEGTKPPNGPEERRAGFDAGVVPRRGLSKGEATAAGIAGLAGIAAHHVAHADEYSEAQMRYLEEMSERIALARELLAQEAENDELRARREAVASELEADAAEIEIVVRELRAQSA